MTSRSSSSEFPLHSGRRNEETVEIMRSSKIAPFDVGGAGSDFTQRIGDEISKGNFLFHF